MFVFSLAAGPPEVCGSSVLGCHCSSGPISGLLCVMVKWFLSTWQAVNLQQVLAPSETPAGDVSAPWFLRFSAFRKTSLPPVILEAMATVVVIPFGIQVYLWITLSYKLWAKPYHGALPLLVFQCSHAEAKIVLQQFSCPLSGGQILCLELWVQGRCLVWI